MLHSAFAYSYEYAYCINTEDTDAPKVSHRLVLHHAMTTCQHRRITRIAPPVLPPAALLVKSMALALGATLYTDPHARMNTRNSKHVGFRCLNACICANTQYRKLPLKPRYRFCLSTPVVLSGGFSRLVYGMRRLICVHLVDSNYGTVRFRNVGRRSLLARPA